MTIVQAGALIADFGIVSGAVGFIWFLWDRLATEPGWVLSAALLCIVIGGSMAGQLW